MDINLNYIERGNGKPLFLLHGNGESADYFVNQIEAFSHYFRVIAVDTRGHGKSPRGAAPFTLSQFSDDLKSLMDRLGIVKAHILGFSDGGNIALTFALKHPEMVEKLVLNGANLYPSGVRLGVQIPIVLGYAVASVVSLFDQKAVPKRELLGLMVKEPHLIPEQLSSLSMPTLVIAGKRDMIKDAHTRSIAAAIPNARLRIIPGDHFIASKESRRFNCEVLAFLND